MNRLMNAMAAKAKLVSLLITSLLFSTITFAGQPLPPLSAEEQAIFNQRVKQALIDDPEILKSAIIALQQHEKNNQAQVQKKGIKTNAERLFSNPNDPWIGAQSPKLTLAYFGDFNCGYCKKLEPSLAKLVAAYPDVRVVFKFVPILGESSQQAAELALTVWEKEPSKFTELREQLMNNKGRLNQGVLSKLTQSTETKQWLGKSSTLAKSTLAENVALMQEFGLTGTPSLIFADQIVAGFVPYEQLTKRIDAALAVQ